MLVFQKDLENFKLSISQKNESKIRKEYLLLLKKYHPDLAEENNKLVSKEITLKIISSYEEYQNSKNHDLKKNQIASENNIPNDNSLYLKLMEIARNEYNEFKKRAVRKGWSINVESRDYLKNAVDCYKKIIKECKDIALVKAARNQLNWVKPLYNLQNKELIARELNKIIKKRNNKTEL